MRRFPSSWDRTLAALGFKRRQSKVKRDSHRRRNSHLEPLEQRAMLAGTPSVPTLEQTGGAATFTGSGEDDEIVVYHDRVEISIAGDEWQSFPYSGATQLTVVGGQGDDVIRVDTGQPVTTELQLDGGAGDDVLQGNASNPWAQDYTHTFI